MIQQYYELKDDDLDPADPFTHAIYHHLMEDSWEQAFELYNEIDDLLSNYIGSNEESLKRYDSRQKTDIQQKIKEMDFQMDFAAGAELDENYEDFNYSGFEKFLTIMDEKNVDDISSFKQEVQNIKSQTEFTEKDKREFLISSFYLSFPEIRKNI